MLRLELGPSRVFTGILILVHGLSIVLIGFSPLPGWLTLFLTGLVLASGLRSVMMHGLKTHPAAIRSLWAKDEGLWELKTAAGNSQEAKLLPGSYVSAHLTVLSFRVAGRIRGMNAVIVPDGVDQASFRQLRVWLKWGSPLRNISPDTHTDLFGQ